MKVFFDIISGSPYVFALVLLAGVALLVVWNSRLQAALKKIKYNQSALFSGKKGSDLEKIILDQKKELRNLDKEIQELYELSNKINSLARKSIHKIGTVRFNPFKDLGGNQSFSVALLDADNNGIVLSSLHTREGTRIYAKPVVKGMAAAHIFTAEEKHAIKISGTKKPQISKGKNSI